MSEQANESKLNELADDLVNNELLDVSTRPGQH